MNSIARLFQDIIDELRNVLAGSGFADSIIPPIVFAVLNAVAGLQSAIWGSLLFVLLIVTFRLIRRQPLKFAIGGLGGVVLAVLVASLLGRAEGYFLPGIFSGVVTIFVAVVSAVIGRPMVAWTSHIARRWPLDWYWHPRVRPAYSEVTWMWAVFFAVRSLLQYAVLRGGSVEQLALTNLVTGWPATVVLLVMSYIYGMWRLKNLKGPSVEEFKAGIEPPWQGQLKGF